MAALFAALIVITALLSFIPVALDKGWRTLSLFYPIVGLLAWAAYEAVLRIELPPESVPIRIDLLFIRPVLLFILLAGISRWALLLATIKRVDQRRGRLVVALQVLSVAGSLGAAALWIRPYWSTLKILVPRWL